MRRKDREIKDPEKIRAILSDSPYLHMAYNDENGLTIVPLSFGYDMSEDGEITLYIHSAKEGRKVSALRSGQEVAIEISNLYSYIDGNGIGCRWSCEYASIVGNAHSVEIIDKEEKEKALSRILDKLTNTKPTLQASSVDATVVFCLSFDSYTAKGRSR